VTITPILTAASAVLLVWATRSSPWTNFRTTEFQHVFFGSCVAVFFLWLMRAGIVPTLPIHLLCLTTLTLMFGAPLAILAAAILTTAMCLAGVASWQAWPVSFIALGVAPVVVSSAMLYASRRYLPPNPFIYIFVGAFFGAAAAMLAAVAINGALQLGMAQVSFGELRDGYLSILPLIMFPEAFVNGLVVTGLVVFKPNWIPSFDDSVYLNG
jgi:uncharacterized membrane protein